MDESQSMEDREYITTSRKRVIQFVQKWVIAVRNAVFEEPAAVDFIEVQYYLIKIFFFFLNDIIMLKIFYEPYV